MTRFTSGLRSSATDEWATPLDLFDELDSEFHFDLDVASTDDNALCEHHYTIEQDGLSMPWDGHVWCNPPYGRQIGKWMKKAAETDRGGGCCLPCTRENGHEMVARERCRPRVRDSVHSWQAQVWECRWRCPVPERNHHLRQEAEPLLGG